MTPGHSHRLHALRYQREKVSAISMKRVSAIGGMHIKSSFRRAAPAFTTCTEPKWPMHRALKVQPVRSPSIKVNGSSGDDTKPCLR